MDRKHKEEEILALKETFEDINLLVVTHYSGLTVLELSDLRRRMREAGASFKVTKNRITKLALKGSKYENLTDVFAGPTAIAYSKDPISAAKVAVDFSKENEKLIVVGGGNGESFLDVNEIKVLASLPSLEEIRRRILGLINTPSSRLVGVLRAPANKLNNVITAYSKK